MKKFLVAAAIGALAMTPLASQSTTMTSNMAVTGTVIAACTVFTAPALAFGVSIYSGQTNIASTAATISYTCANGFTATSIGLNGGLHCTGGPPCTARFLKDATVDTLQYDIFSDAAHTTVWGDAGTTYAGAAGPVLTASTGVAKTISVYGLIAGPIGGAQATGAYTDTVIATLTF
jgi:spore coat protein U-like protein